MIQVSHHLHVGVSTVAHVRKGDDGSIHEDRSKRIMKVSPVVIFVLEYFSFDCCVEDV